MTGEELKKYRVKKGITQRKLGELLGYEGASADRVVQNSESDKQPIPIKYWRDIAKILGFPVDKFIP